MNPSPLIPLGPQEVMGCIQILQSLILDYRLKVQRELDRKKVEYLEAKCQIVCGKIRWETATQGRLVLVGCVGSAILL